jgi:hypothetical protein
VGTLDFVAPEQIRGDRIDGRADIYALGCVLHFALTGQAPYPRETDESRLWAHLHAAPPEPSRLVDGVPASLDDVVRRALAKRPEERQPSAGEFGAAAVAAATGTTAVARPRRDAARRRRNAATAVTWSDAPHGRRRRPGFWTVAVMLAAAVGAGAAVLFANGGADHSPATTSTLSELARDRGVRGRRSECRVAIGAAQSDEHAPLGGRQHLADRHALRGERRVGARV